MRKSTDVRNVVTASLHEEVVVSPEAIHYKPRPKASWRSGYAEDCKSLHPGSIPGEASKITAKPVQFMMPIRKM